MLIFNEIAKSFNAKAIEYERAARAQQLIGERLFERLDYLKITPKFILDLGCGPGKFTYALKKRYPNAHVVGFDLAEAMLVQAKLKQRLWTKWSLVSGNMLSMPFTDNVFDLVFANQVLHWADSNTALFAELNRVMAVNACLQFTTLGPDTFIELKRAWEGVDPFSHTNEFRDMHLVGDDLLAAHFIDPVIDMENLALHYETISQLVRSLKTQGVRNINPKRRQSLMGKNRWAAFEQAFEKERLANGKYPLNYEVIYGHAWKGTRQKTAQGIETIIPVSQLTKT